MIENKKSYYAVIPATVRYDKRLKPLARLLYGELTALSNEKGYCWASNKYFAELYEVTSETVSRWISQLAEYGYIRLSISRAGKMIVERKIYLSQGLIDEKINTSCQKDQEVIDEKINTPIDKKVKENNTDNNTTENNTLNRDADKPLYAPDSRAS
jgi:DNA-binding MarR family transcriptional regulator